MCFGYLPRWKLSYSSPSPTKRQRSRALFLSLVIHFPRQKLLLENNQIYSHLFLKFKAICFLLSLWNVLSLCSTMKVTMGYQEEGSRKWGQIGQMRRRARSTCQILASEVKPVQGLGWRQNKKHSFGEREKWFMGKPKTKVGKGLNGLCLGVKHRKYGMYVVGLY